MRRGALLAFTLLVLAVGPARAEVRLVAGGRPEAVVVTAAPAGSVAAYAAEELVAHVRKATGATLPVATEDAIPAHPACRVYVGDCKAARAAGIDASKLPPETFVLKTVGGALFIVGEDSEGDPLSEGTRAGTLWGVYEVLEELVGARWLWPGELGVAVRKTPTLAVGDLDRRVPPRMLLRRLRSGLRRGNYKTGFTPEGFEKYSRDQQVFLRRHRMGKALDLRFGHAFETWWGKYGQEHPEWFQLLESGRRGPERPGGHTSMCVSNSGFHRQIVELWKGARAENPGQFLNINACDNDIRALCTCPACYAWDGPMPEGMERIYPGVAPRFASDRYARYWLSVQQLAAKEDPEALVVAYAYLNYFPAPTTGIKLNPNVIVGMCPWPGFWFPRSPEEQKWFQAQWKGWAETGARLFLRPNYTLDAYCMPHVYAHQLAEELQFAARNGMAATDFDSLTGQWSTQGTTLYLLARLHVRPEKPVEAVLSEYYSAFGAAAADVKAYFDYWEKRTTEDRQRTHDVVAGRKVSRYRQFAKVCHELFPPESFTPAEALLAKAAKAVAKDPEAAARVDFLRKGLAHAKLCVKAAALLEGTQEAASPMAARRAVNELVAFRRSVERDNIANLHYAASVEERSWQVPEGYGGEPLRPLAENPAALEGTPAFPVRGASAYVALLKPGERFRARIACRRIGQTVDQANWSLFGPDDALLGKGSVEAGHEGEIDVPARAGGVHLLAVASGKHLACVTLLNDHAAVTTRRLALTYAASPLYFFVPAGVKEFTLTLDSPAPGETARVTVLDPEGKEAASGSTGAESRVELKLKVPAGQDGRAWSAVPTKAETGTLEDYALSLDEALPPFWSHAPDRLVVP